MSYITATHFRDLSFLPRPVVNSNNNNNKVGSKKRKTGSGFISDFIPYSNIANKVLDNIPLGSIVNTAIDHLPFEAHLPGYNYLGPGTRLAEKLKYNVKPINQLDAAALDHDKAYASTKDGKERAKADKILENKAWNRVLASDSSLGEKAAAWLTTNAMKVKEALGSGIPPKEGGVLIHRGPLRRRRHTKKKKKKKIRKSMASKRRRKTRCLGVATTTTTVAHRRHPR